MKKYYLFLSAIVGFFLFVFYVAISGGMEVKGSRWSRAGWINETSTAEEKEIIHLLGDRTELLVNPNLKRPKSTPR